MFHLVQSWLDSERKLVVSPNFWFMRNHDRPDIPVLSESFSELVRGHLQGN